MAVTKQAFQASNAGTAAAKPELTPTRAEAARGITAATRRVDPAWEKLLNQYKTLSTISERDFLREQDPSINAELLSHRMKQLRATDESGNPISTDYRRKYEDYKKSALETYNNLRLYSALGYDPKPFKNRTRKLWGHTPDSYDGGPGGSRIHNLQFAKKIREGKVKKLGGLEIVGNRDVVGRGLSYNSTKGFFGSDAWSRAADFIGNQDISDFRLVGLGKEDLRKAGIKNSQLQGTDGIYALTNLKTGESQYLGRTREKKDSLKPFPTSKSFEKAIKGISKAGLGLLTSKPGQLALAIASGGAATGAIPLVSAAGGALPLLGYSTGAGATLGAMASGGRLDDTLRGAALGASFAGPAVAAPIAGSVAKTVGGTLGKVAGQATGQAIGQLPGLLQGGDVEQYLQNVGTGTLMATATSGANKMAQNAGLSPAQARLASSVGSSVLGSQLTGADIDPAQLVTQNVGNITNVATERNTPTGGEGQMENIFDYGNDQDSSNMFTYGDQEPFGGQFSGGNSSLTGGDTVFGSGSGTVFEPTLNTQEWGQQNFGQPIGLDGAIQNLTPDWNSFMQEQQGILNDQTWRQPIEQQTQQGTDWGQVADTGMDIFDRLLGITMGDDGERQMTAANAAADSTIRGASDIYTRNEIRKANRDAAERLNTTRQSLERMNQEDRAGFQTAIDELNQVAGMDINAFAGLEIDKLMSQVNEFINNPSAVESIPGYQETYNAAENAILRGQARRGVTSTNPQTLAHLMTMGIMNYQKFRWTEVDKRMNMLKDYQTAGQQEAKRKASALEQIGDLYTQKNKMANVGAITQSSLIDAIRGAETGEGIAGGGMIDSGGELLGGLYNIFRGNV